MLSYQATTVSGGNTTTDTVYTDILSRPMHWVTYVDNGSDGVIDSVSMQEWSYGVHGQTFHYRGDDLNNDSYYEVESISYRFYDEAGRLSKETFDSPDWNGDNVPDYTTVVNHSYNELGQLVVSDWDYLYDGVDNMIDDRVEVRTYTPEGQVDTLTISDNSMFDFDVMHDFNYNASGQLSEEWVTDPFIREEPRLFQKLSYDNQGRVAEHVQYGVLSPDGKYLSEQKLSYKYDIKKGPAVQVLTEGKGDDGSIVLRTLHEEWKNKEGFVTDILTSYDGNLDGKFTPGSKSGHKDSRDREWIKYDADGDITSHKIDHGLNGVDWEYTATPLPVDDMLIA